MVQSRVLIRVPKAASAALKRQGFAAAGSAFQVTPLFDVKPAAPALAAAGDAGSEWLLAQTHGEPDVENQWDLAHNMLIQAGLQGLAGGGGGVIVEPDLLQTWTLAKPEARPGTALAATAPCTSADQRDDLPKGPGFAWHLLDNFAGLKSARALAQQGSGIAIAHFDTGYDPNHVTLPTGLDKAAQKNFADPERSPDAIDPGISGFLLNPGHGTATLALLAGNKPPNFGDFLGGAPGARIIPVRVANSVVQIRTSSVAQAFDYARQIGVDVVSMSMGGVASSAWTDAVNAAYEAGIVMVCAAGNNFGGFPTRNIVYPARYKRVLAACGVMADMRPYFNLPITIMQGNFGPDSKMDTAMSAFTPNTPWAAMGCQQLVNMNGEGTSSATPQIAAAAALWLAKHQPAYPERWMRVEAARKALFDSAAKNSPMVPGSDFRDIFGNGLLRSAEALKQQPAAAAALRKMPADTATFPFLRIITGLGLAPDPRIEMLTLEMTQLASQLRALEEAVPDPDLDPEHITPAQQKRFYEVIIESGKSSRALREYLEQRVKGTSGTRAPGGSTTTASSGLVDRKPPEILPPAHRRLQIFALDPSFSSRLDTTFINTATVKVPWEYNSTSRNLLQPGPVGEYVEVVDIDPASDACYAPVDLNQPFLLAQDGLTPSEGNPQFHQQMVYAVSMLAIKNFERALGRVALWSPNLRKQGAAASAVTVDEYVPRLRIYPHALRQANAYYSPDKKALLFGYFTSTQPDAEQTGGMIFTCLSHDIVAHETTHALLDGLHRRYNEASNPDVLAFHEAFADIVAILQHFTFPELLRHTIQKSRGDLTQGAMLAELARQFGEGLGRSRALRSAIDVDPAILNYNTTREPHDRGSILVAAVFEAFLSIYQRRTADLIRIATGGTGVLPTGAIHPDLVNRLAMEAAKCAGHVLNICIRALDYTPPVDITFGSYLRALITADFDAVPDDEHGYRVAFVEAFRRREIYPESVRTLSMDSLRWQAPMQQPANLPDALATLTTDWDLFKNRRQAYESARANAAALHKWVTTPGNLSKSAARQMGIDLSLTSGSEEHARLEVHSVRPARRVAPDGSFMTDLVVVLTQRRRELLYPGKPALGSFWFRGGCTLLIDVRRKEVRYIVSRNINSTDRLNRQRAFMKQAGNSLRALYFGDSGAETEPFALIHRGL